MPTFESAVDAALVCVLDAEDPDVEPQIAGTAFAVAGGRLITCHHVVDGRGRLLLRTVDGRERELDPAEIVLLPDVDLAVLPAGDLDLAPLPVAADKAGVVNTFWAKGFHRVGAAVRAASPVEGNSTGRTDVSYATPTSSYAIDGVLMLRRDTFGPGLSGAPVVDPDSGVVIGVVSTRLREGEQAGGFAVPWVVALRHPEIADLLAESHRRVPAYGRFLNLAAAHELCRRQLRRSVDELTGHGRVDLTGRVERAGVGAALGRFFHDDTQILPLVGPSGVGKSTELTALAAAADGTALLLKGSAISPSHRHLGEAVAAVLRELPGDEPRPERLDLELPAAFARAGLRLVVLLDGLNEVPFGRDLRPDQWMISSVTWLRDTNAKLIVSSRPELWQSLAESTGRPTLGLGEFSESETAIAALSYGLTLPSTHQHVLRLPLMLRLYAELTRSTEAAVDPAPGVNDLMEAYVLDRCRAVATHADRLASASRVRERLERATAEMWASGSDLLPPERVEAIFGRDEGDALLDEHVLTVTRNGYRFVFDDAAEWLKGIGLDPDLELAPARLTELNEPGGWRRIGALAYMLREIERSDGTAALATRLRALIANAEDHDEIQERYGALELVRATVRPVADPGAYLDVLDLLADAEVVTYTLLTSTEFWRSLPLPLPTRLSLARSLVRDSNYFPWRSKDWHNQPIRSGAAEHDCAALALEIAEEDPAVAIPALQPWLADDRRLRGDDYHVGHGEATVGDVAAGIMYRLFAGNEALVLEQIGAAWPHGRLLLDELVAHHAADVAAWLVEHETRAPEGMISRTLDISSNLGRAEPWRTTLREVNRRLYERAHDPSIRGAALGRILATAGKGETAPSADEIALADAALYGFRGGDLLISDTTLAEAVRLRPAEGFAELRSALRDEGLANVLDALTTLANSYGYAGQTDSIVLAHFRAGGDTGGYWLGSYVETRLRHDVTPTVALIELTREVIASGDGGQLQCVAYALVSADTLAGLANLRNSLLDELVAEVIRRSDSTAWAIFSVLVTQRDDNPEPDARIWSILSSLDPDDADQIAISRASGHPEFAGPLVAWLRTRTDRLGRRGRRILELVDTGLSPAEAVAKFLQDSLS
jgi:hypothetical protein